MARVKGRDLVLEMMDVVASLEATAKKHADLIESLAAHAISTSAELTSVAGRLAQVSQRVADVSERVADVSNRVADVSNRVADVSERVGSLEREFKELAAGFVESAGLVRTTQAGLKRLTRLMVEMAGGTGHRLDDLEVRVTRLEKKTG